MDYRCEAFHVSFAGIDVEAAGDVSCATFVVGYEIFETVLFACISFDALHDAFAADCAVVGYIVVHTAVLL